MSWSEITYSLRGSKNEKLLKVFFIFALNKLNMTGPKPNHTYDVIDWLIIYIIFDIFKVLFYIVNFIC